MTTIGLGAAAFGCAVGDALCAPVQARRFLGQQVIDHNGYQG